MRHSRKSRWFSAKTTSRETCETRSPNSYHPKGFLSNQMCGHAFFKSPLAVPPPLSRKRTPCSRLIHPTVDYKGNEESTKGREKANARHTPQSDMGTEPLLPKTLPALTTFWGPSRPHLQRTLQRRHYVHRAPCTRE